MADRRAAVRDAAPGLACTCLRLRRTARRVTQIYDAHLTPSGLTITQFGVLAAIADGAPASVTRLAALMMADRTTVSRTLRPLQRSGHVEIRAGENRRMRTVVLTPRGRRAYHSALPLWHAAQAAVDGALGARDTRHLRLVLDDALARCDGL